MPPLNFDSQSVWWGMLRFLGGGKQEWVLHCEGCELNKECMNIERGQPVEMGSFLNSLNTALSKENFRFQIMCLSRSLTNCLTTQSISSSLVSKNQIAFLLGESLKWRHPALKHVHSLLNLKLSPVHAAASATRGCQNPPVWSSLSPRLLPAHPRKALNSPP